MFERIFLLPPIEYYKKRPLDYPEDGGNPLQNDSNCSPIYIASYAIRLESSLPLLEKLVYHNRKLYGKWRK
jgi:hypothetical protein